MDLGVIVAAGGGGRRSEGDKLWRMLGGEVVLARVLKQFLACAEVDRVVVVLRMGDEARFEKLVETFGEGERLCWVLGGAERQDSVFCGLQELSGLSLRQVLIHDGARPFFTAELLQRVIESLREHEAVMPVLPVVDTLRRVGIEGELVSREGLVAVQTPQGFWWETIWQAHCLARERGSYYTDDAEAVLQSGKKVHMELGVRENVKLTTREDFVFAEQLLTGIIQKD